MKVIDLLNKIANKEELPKKIKNGDFILTLNENKDNYLYEENDEYYGKELIHWVLLNDEVEILEEEKKIPEKLEKYIHTDSLNYNQCNYMFEKLTYKYNEIIDYLRSKGE